MKPCKTCSELQAKPANPGTAQERQKYRQPSMYDHMPSYSQFKQDKQFERQIKTRKEEYVNQNPRFTDLIIEPAEVESCFDNLSTQDIASFRATIKGIHSGLPIAASTATTEPSEGGLTFVVSDLTEMLTCNDHKTKATKSSESLIKISRSPINCPVSQCQQTIGITSLLSHFMRDHKQSFPVDFQDIQGDRRSVLIFDQHIFDRDDNTICLGMLAYGGKDETETSLPAQRGICRPNSFLPERFMHYVNHLPILILGCKTCLTSLLSDKEQVEELKNSGINENEANDILIIWLATIETTKNIHCTITAFDRDMTSSRSTIVMVRNLKLSQAPSEFLAIDTNYLMLNRGELNILSNNKESLIELEVFVHEFS